MRNYGLLVGPDDKFGHWTVLSQDPERLSGNIRFFCQCECGKIKSVQARQLIDGRTTKCSRWCPAVNPKKPKPLPKGPYKYGGLTCGPGRRQIRPYDVWIGIKRRGVCCEEWLEDFPAFLTYYLKQAKMELSDFDRPNVPWNYFKIARPDKTKPYGPNNLLVIPFRTERAWHQPTYQYWWKLRHEKLLEQEHHDSYVEFVNTFGLKEPHRLLSRIDITQPHSSHNSKWIKTARSTT